MDKLNQLIKLLNTNPETVEFQNIINVINDYYHYTPTQFSNGPPDNCIINDAGENEGSCKIFSFAKIHNLNEAQTLQCFGQYYRDDVLKHPENTDHGNIRTFIKYGWKNIKFENMALKKKQE